MIETDFIGRASIEDLARSLFFQKEIGILLVCSIHPDDREEQVMAYGIVKSVEIEDASGEKFVVRFRRENFDFYYFVEIIGSSGSV